VTALLLGVDVALLMLVLLVQFIIYPAFADIERGVFAAHHRRYMRVITYFVAPLMTAQIGLHAWSAWSERSALAIAAATLVVATWGSTRALSVPVHRRLAEEGNTSELVARLVRTNWPRTLLWAAIATSTAWRVARVA
jgi:hypothetical protein